MYVCLRNKKNYFLLLHTLVLRPMDLCSFMMRHRGQSHLSLLIENTKYFKIFDLSNCEYCIFSPISFNTCFVLMVLLNTHNICTVLVEK